MDPVRTAQAAFWSLLVVTLVVMAIMNLVGAPLTNPAAPSSIVSFELAGDPAQAQAILDSWDPLTRQYAAFGLGFDYVFMLAYAASIGLACLMSGDGLRSGVGRWLAWAARCPGGSGWRLPWMLLRTWGWRWCLKGAASPGQKLPGGVRWANSPCCSWVWYMPSWAWLLTWRQRPARWLPVADALLA
jgi:hypothetical protein